MSPKRYPWWAHLILLRPHVVDRHLSAIVSASPHYPHPNTWQLCLGVIRMAHRVAFRSDTVGTCTDFEVRDSVRARLLQYRPLRFPFLLRAKAVRPWDLTGLMADPKNLYQHLLGAHHDGLQFVYDFELLRPYPETVRALRDKARSIADGSHPQADFLKDLTVYRQYHDNLLEMLERFLQDPDFLSPDDQHNADLSLYGFLFWCAAQPTSPEETLRLVALRKYHPEHGVLS